MITVFHFEKISMLFCLAIVLEYARTFLQLRMITSAWNCVQVLLCLKLRSDLK